MDVCPKIFDRQVDFCNRTKPDFSLEFFAIPRTLQGTATLGFFF
jgi:hypothetical protein